MKQKHLLPLSRTLLLVVLIPLLMLAFVLLFDALARNYDHNAQTVRENEAAVIESINVTLTDVAAKVRARATSTNYLFFSNSSKPLRVTRYGMDLLSALSQELLVYSEYRGVILYNSKIDRLYKKYSATNFEFSDSELREMMTPASNRLETSVEIFLRGGLPHILLIYRQRYGSVAVLLDLGNNSTYQSFLTLHSDGNTRFVSETENTVDSTFEFYSEPIKNTSIRLAYTVNTRMEFVGFSGVQLIALVILLVLLVTSVYVIFYIQRILLKPLKTLSDSFDIMSSGDTSYRIQTNSNIYEIENFYSSFITMLDNMQEAQNESHRQQMDAAQAKLQYLQLQIRPHFYLNCLKNINSLAAMHEDEKIQTMVIALSDYFRYNFQDVKNFVTVREELTAVQSYVDLCRCLYNEINLEFDLESDVMTAKCLPLTTLTFVENCIKHGQDLTSLTIRIRAYVELREDDPYVITEVANTGEFTQDALETLNTDGPVSMVYQREKVGISNVKYRMWLIYGDQGSITFENRDGFAVARITYPILRNK